MVTPSCLKSRPREGGSSRSLSRNLQQLFWRIWRLGFGTISGVPFRDGDPAPSSHVRAVRKALLGQRPWPHCDDDAEHFLLKQEHCRFIEELAISNTGMVDIKVMNGLPIALDIHEQF